VEERKVGDIFVHVAPFLRMYSEYTTNLENACNVMSNLCKSKREFAAAVAKVEAMPECKSIKLIWHMNSLYTRIGRYKLLLETYLKNLPQGSVDLGHTKQALSAVADAAFHCDKAGARLEKFNKLMEIQQSLGDRAIDLVSPTREFLKEGKIKKISQRTGEHQERHLFLFSDLLLLCSAGAWGMIGAVGGTGYKLRARFDLEMLTVQEGDNMITSFTFYISDNERTIELYTGDRKEKYEWLDTLSKAMHDLQEKKSSLKTGVQTTMRPPDSEIGKVPPTNVLKQNASVQKCMECGASLRMKKEHNCRACGIVACAKCTSYKFSLSFDDNGDGKPSRVCKYCYDLLQSRDTAAAAQAATASKQLHGSAAAVDSANNCRVQCSRNLLEVPADCDEAVVSGYMLLRAYDVKSGQITKPVRRWFVLRDNFVLYSYEHRKDEQALTATPLPGHTIATGCQELEGDEAVPNDQDKNAIIKMFVLPPSVMAAAAVNSNAVGGGKNAIYKKAYYFKSKSASDAQKWAEALRLATRAEKPTEQTNQD